MGAGGIGRGVASSVGGRLCVVVYIVRILVQLEDARS